MGTSRSPWRTAVATGEVLLCATAVILDWFIPTLVILMIAAGSLAIRRQRPAAAQPAVSWARSRSRPHCSPWRTPSRA